MTNPVKLLIGNLKSLLTFGSSGANKNVATDANGDLIAEDKNNHSHGQIGKDGQVSTTTSTVNNVVVTDDSNNIKVINKLPATNVTHQDISGKVNTSDIKDNLTSTDTNKPLSANQGRELKTLIDKSTVPTGTFTELQTLITNASSGDVISLDKDYKRTGNETSIGLSKNITIIGNGHTIDGNNVSIFGEINTNNVVVYLYDLTCINGNSTNGGSGVVMIVDGTLICTNCVFKNNKGQMGGVFYAYGGSLNLYNCDFIGNTTSKYNGGAISLGYGLVNNIIGCGFYQNKCIEPNNNSSSYAKGGAIYNQGSSNTTNRIENCVFKNNSAINGGNNIYSVSNGFVVYNCDVTDGLEKCVNKIYSSELSNKIDSSNIVDNLTTNDATKVLSAKQGKTLKDSLDNLSTSIGTFTELQTLIDNANAGDIISLDKDYKNSGSESAIKIHKDLTILGNGHTIDGNNSSNCIKSYMTSCNIVLSDLYLINGSNDSGGGGITLSSGGSITLFNSTLKNNHGQNGGGVFFIHGLFSAYNCEFIGNYISNSDGGAIQINSNQPSIIKNCSFISNSAQYGGAIYIDQHTSDNVYIDNCEFVNNSATTNGSNVYSVTSNRIIYNCNVSTGLYNCTNQDYRTKLASLEDEIGDIHTLIYGTGGNS